MQKSSDSSNGNVIANDAGTLRASTSESVDDGGAASTFHEPLLNAEPLADLRTLCSWIAIVCKDIDAKTVADAACPELPPQWWSAMCSLRGEARRCKESLPKE